ncbi:MAG: site-specific integrase [Proteobacteria bacterium]|nr:site-specific integrase [Pseudomonadota bacterium]
MGVSLSKDNTGSLTVAFKYDPLFVEKVKTIPGHKWNQEKKYWSFPNSKQILDTIIFTFAGEDLNIDPTLQTLTSQIQGEKKTNHIVRSEETLPDNPIFEQVRNLIRLKHYSIRTEKSYLSWIQRYIIFHNKKDPAEMGSSEIEAFLSHLAVNLNVSASTQNQAFNALLFLYRDVLKKNLDESINAIRAKKTNKIAYGNDQRGSCKTNQSSSCRSSVNGETDIWEWFTIDGMCEAACERH